MHFDFEAIINRKNTNCAKWDTLGSKYGRSDLIHLGVADMDFAAPPAIIEAFQKIIDHGIFGYTDINQKFYDSIIKWQKEKLEVNVSQKEIVFCPRINIAAGCLIRSCTSRDARIIINSPGYSPLYESISKNGRTPVENPLVRDGDIFKMDFENLKKIVDEKTEMFILCNPDNPSGRVWSIEEMNAISDFCDKNDLILFSDEIHSDLISSGNSHTSINNLNNNSLKNVYANSITKSFNVPGIIISYLIIKDENIRKKVNNEIDVLGMHNPNIFSVVAVEAAYMKSESWLKSLNNYLDANDIFFRDFILREMPAFRVLPREGTALLWIDCSSINLTEEELSRWFIEEARVEVYMGSNFGFRGIGYIRVNIGTSRKILEKALIRMKKAFPKLMEKENQS
ncbi:MalY/PatB family protein [Alkalispirochaeta sphaeroplastigenens]|uniref:MalY/PatB family protein n=1 Tax=Alkalispirochaeta sphaeroplastigenens TaxID=1187066 RepID=UPI000CDACD5C|nr:PatB family C-S lyase [Alkalispirochaeta sphaeroplastigenens]